MERLGAGFRNLNSKALKITRTEVSTNLKIDITSNAIKTPRPFHYFYGLCVLRHNQEMNELRFFDFWVEFGFI